MSVEILISAIGGQICTTHIYCLQIWWASYVSQSEVALAIYLIAKSAYTYDVLGPQFWLVAWYILAVMEL